MANGKVSYYSEYRPLVSLALNHLVSIGHHFDYHDVNNPIKFWTALHQSDNYLKFKAEVNKNIIMSSCFG